MKTWKTPAPLYEDPIFAGPSDPCVIRNQETGEWWMFYTQRRVSDNTPGVSGIHGTDIGIAVSADAKHWLYRGKAEGLAYEWGHNTYWAPEVVWTGSLYHMFVTYIQGVPSDWTKEAKILHYTSENLWQWRFSDAPDLHSDRVIDACIACTGSGAYKLWYKDECRFSHTVAAVSPDLIHWNVVGEEICDVPHEGPNVFSLGGWNWMITDTWNGLGVYRSDDYTHWTRQDEDILSAPGVRPSDGQIGNHADVVTVGNLGYIFYFVHPDYPAHRRSDAPKTIPAKKQHTVIQCAVLRVRDGKLVCDRNEDFDIADMLK